jgi:hypothetical protein
MAPFQWAFSVLIVLSLVSSTSAQNVSGYGSIPDPFLFLLREPAVHADLGLTAPQRQRLVEFNESVDGILLASRNEPPQKGQQKIAEVRESTVERVSRLLSAAQQERLRQITYRMRGLSFVLSPLVAQRLALTEQQAQEIRTAVQVAAEQVKAVSTETYQGEKAHQQAQQAALAARQKEHDTILAVLSDDQRQQLASLVGRRFHPDRLGRVTFKAPELTGGSEWVNSRPLNLQDLRGKVVALHFWAYG